MESNSRNNLIPPGPYRATRLWNEVVKYFRAGMPLKKHRQHFKIYTNCFTATAAVDFLHELLKNNSNFGPEVTRHQTVQLLKKFLKNHVIEDVKGRWGLEELEDNSQLYRFPSASPLKPVPVGPPRLRKKSLSSKDREGFFKLRSSKIFDKEIQENIAPSVEDHPTVPNPDSAGGRDLSEDHIRDIWKNTTLNHLQKLLGLSSLEGVVGAAEVDSSLILYNVTKVNKHGVVTLEDKTDDLPHWVLSAMKCLANWPKFDSDQPSYPGFERDVFRTVSDYFCSLPEPLLTFQYYELFVNVLVLCGYIAAPPSQRGKRKNLEEPSCPQPAKAPHLNTAHLFRSTECLLLSLIRKESFEEAESPMTEVFLSKVKRQPTVSRKSVNRFRPRSCSLERILDESADSCSKTELFRSVESLSSCRSNGSRGSYPQDLGSHSISSVTVLPCETSSGEAHLDDHVFTNNSGSSFGPSPEHLANPTQKASKPRPRSIGNCLDLVELKEKSASCFSINAPVAEITLRPARSSLAAALRGVSAEPSISRRCHSSLDLSQPTRPSVSSVSHRLSPEQRLLQPALERLAVEVLQLCTLLLPPASRRKLQLLLRMISRMSQNVDMPRLHDGIGTRTLMVQTFSRCVLSCEEELDLDELLASRLLSFLMDHHQEVLQVPVYLRSAVDDHLTFLRSQTTLSGIGIGVAMPTSSFCRQISAQEFEEQKLSLSQAAISDLLESLIKDKDMSVKEKKKKLKLFQKEYPEIYCRRFPSSESELQLFADKPKIKPPLLISMKTRAFSLRH